MNKTRILDKSKRCNRRCGSCEFWKEYNPTPFKLIKGKVYYCSNCYSTEYLKDKHYWNYCKEFEWASNIVDKNELN